MKDRKDWKETEVKEDETEGSVPSEGKGKVGNAKERRYRGSQMRQWVRCNVKGQRRNDEDDGKEGELGMNGEETRGCNER